MKLQGGKIESEQDKFILYQLLKEILSGDNVSYEYEIKTCEIKDHPFLSSAGTAYVLTITSKKSFLPEGEE